MKDLFSKLLAHLRAQAMYLQTAHWTSKGTEYYSDHQLFERLYNGVDSEIDALGEKAVGLTGGETVNLTQSLAMALDTIQGLPQDCQNNFDCFLAAGKLEQELITLCTAGDHLEDATLGFKNLMADIADRAEGRFYLIKQRLLKG